MLLALIEHSDGAVAEVSLELLTFGRQLAEQLAVPLEAVVIGPMASVAVSRLGGYGVNTAHVVEHRLLDDYAPEAHADGITQLIAKLQPDGIIAPGTEKGNELLAHVAARTDLPMAANCTDVEAGDEWTLTRLRWGGSLLEEASLHAAIKLITLAPHAVAAAAAGDAGDVAVQRFDPELDDALGRTRVRDRVTGGGGVSLASAQVVVSGGRGVGSAEGFAPLEELAGLLGGAVGCSRVATNNGWRSHNDQVGQTGTRIAPQLYIACGISGATQHWVGCKDSKNILAINTDPEAPLVTRSNYAVIGSVQDVLPAVIDEVKRRKGRP